MKKITLILAFIFHSVMSYSQIGTYTFNNIYYVEADTAFVFLKIDLILSILKTVIV